MKTLQEFLRSHFVRGLLCGGIAVLLLFTSWRFVLLFAGVAAIYYLVKCFR